jgi:uncharacterized membrane protein
MRDSDLEGPVNKTNIERITNGFFAFTMTLLIRNLTVPTGVWETEQALIAAISQYLLDLAAYLFVFLVLAVTWVLLFRVYRNVVAVDLGFVALVFVALLLVVFLPVTSQFDAAIDAPIAGIFSQLNLGLLGLTTWALFRYSAARPALRDPRLTDRHVTRMLRREYLVLPALSAVALILSAQGADLAGIVYLLAPFALWWMINRDGLGRAAAAPVPGTAPLSQPPPEE